MSNSEIMNACLRNKTWCSYLENVSEAVKKAKTINTVLILADIIYM